MLVLIRVHSWIRFSTHRENSHGAHFSRVFWHDELIHTTTCSSRWTSSTLNFTPYAYLPLRTCNLNLLARHYVCSGREGETRIYYVWTLYENSPRTHAPYWCLIHGALINYFQATSKKTNTTTTTTQLSWYSYSYGHEESHSLRAVDVTEIVWVWTWKKHTTDWWIGIFPHYVLYNTWIRTKAFDQMVYSALLDLITTTPG